MSSAEEKSGAEDCLKIDKNDPKDIANSNDNVIKTERDIKRELIDLTVVDDSEINRMETTNTDGKSDAENRPSKNNEDCCNKSERESCTKSIETKETKQERTCQKVKAQSPDRKCQVMEHDSLIITADDVDLDNEVFSIVSNDKDSPRKPQKVVGEINHDNRKPKQDATAKTEKSCKNKSGDEKHKEDQKKSVKPKANGGDATSKNASRSLWVANVSKSLKATSLKQHFSKYGKVVTAKVVTDGKNFYGYLSFDKREDAERCLRKLDGTTFEDRKLKLSLTRPGQDPSRSQNAPEKLRRTSADSKPKTKVDDNDPLTTKFSTPKPERSRTSTKSRSPSYRERQLQRDFLREKREAERLKRRVLEQEERNRIERQRQKQKEEEQRQLEWKLKMQRKQLQIEREMFEKERKEVIKLDEERRRIEQERLEILKEKAKLKEELRNARKVESKKRSDIEKEDEKRHKMDVKSKICDASYNKPKSEDHYNRYRKESKERERGNFSRAPPPPPKLSEPPKSKISRGYDGGIHRRDEDLKKTERDYRKIETIHRERRPDFQGRRDQFFSRNQQRDGGFTQQEPWKTSFVEKPWEVDQHSSTGRYEQNYQASGSYSGPRVDGGYCYHTQSPGEDYSRYQQYNMHLDRKY